MAEVGLFSVTVFKDKSATDTRQIAAASATVTVYAEGAWANGTSSIADTATDNIPVHDIGSVIAGNNVKIFSGNALSTAIGNVNSFTATTINVTVSGGTLSWSDGDRIVVIDAVTLYSDDAKAETKTNPLTADSNGFAFGYTQETEVDYIVSGTGITTTLFPDKSVVRQESIVSSELDSATATGFSINTLHTYSTSGAKLASIQNNDTEKFYIDKDGDVWTKTGVFVSGVANSGTNIGFDLDVDAAFTGTTKLLRITNNTVETFLIEDDGAWTSQAGGTIVAGGLAITAGNITMGGALLHGTITALADDGSPTVLGRNVFLTGGTTTITDFDDGVEGQIITVIAEHSLTITDGTNIFLDASGNWAMVATDTLTLIQKADGKWYEMSRSDNG